MKGVGSKDTEKSYSHSTLLAILTFRKRGIVQIKLTFIPGVDESLGAEITVLGVGGDVSSGGKYYQLEVSFHYPFQPF